MIANRLRQLRNEFGFNQQDIADRLGMKRASYAKYELGNTSPPQDKLIELADIFDVSIDYLVGRTNVRKLDLPVNVSALQMAQEIDQLNDEQQEQLSKYIEFVKFKYGEGNTQE